MLDHHDIRIFAVTGHAHSGKTSLCEAILFKSGAITRYGSVDAGQTVSDYTPEEKERKTSIHSAALKCGWQNNTFFMLDTPGYADFFCDVVSSVYVADTVIIVVDGVSGIDVGTQRVQRYLERHKIPYAIFVSKLDKQYADFDTVVEHLHDAFGDKLVPTVMPVGHEEDLNDVADILTGEGIEKLPADKKELAAKYKRMLYDIAAETDDELLESYLAGKELCDKEVYKGLQKSILECNFVPIMCGSADKQVGIKTFMDEICSLFASPAQRLAKPTSNPDIIKTADPNAHLSAQVFKNITDPYIGHLTYLRIYSGQLKANSELFNNTRKVKERIGHIYHVQGKEQVAIESAGPGEVIAITKLKSPRVGDTFNEGFEDFYFEDFDMPKPMASFAVMAKARSEEEKLANSLYKLAEDEPSINIERNAETHELVLSVMGELQLGIVRSQLKEKFGIECDFGVPKVAYRETIRVPADGHEKHKKQSGGRGQYAEVYLKVEPAERGAGFEFKSAIVGGVIPKNFIPAIEKGLHEVMAKGILSGSPVVDCSVTVYDGSFHPVDSSELAFKVAGAKAFKDAFAKANSCLLEPIMTVEATVPQEFMGDVTGLYNTKRGRVLGMETLGNMQTIKAQVPISEMFNFSKELRSITGGRGSFLMDFSHYEEVPGMISQKVIEEYQKQRAEAEHA